MKEVINTHYIMGYKIEKQNITETTFKKTKTSKIILHIIIIIISWIIGYAILSNILYLGYLIGVYKKKWLYTILNYFFNFTINNTNNS